MGRRGGGSFPIRSSPPPSRLPHLVQLASLAFVSISHPASSFLSSKEERGPPPPPPPAVPGANLQLELQVRQLYVVGINTDLSPAQHYTLYYMSSKSNHVGTVGPGGTLDHGGWKVSDVPVLATGGARRGWEEGLSPTTTTTTTHQAQLSSLCLRSVPPSSLLHTSVAFSFDQIQRTHNKRS